MSLYQQTDHNVISKKILVFFDGPCNFCNSFISFIIKHDIKDEFVFASLQSKFATLNLRNINYDTIVVKHNNLLLYRSKAVLYIFSRLRFPYFLVSVLKIVSTKLLDYLYDFIAKRRNKLFKKNKCIIPTDSIKKKFIYD